MFDALILIAACVLGGFLGAIAGQCFANAAFGRQGRSR